MIPFIISFAAVPVKLVFAAAQPGPRDPIGSFQASFLYSDILIGEAG
jgi:hypothetical protein